jgi:hypothetical protein
MKIKGTIIIDYVRIIRANRDRDWDKYLEPEDWGIINNSVLPSAKYPYESGRRIGFAVFKEIANSNLDTVRVFGRFSAKNLLDVYKNLIIQGDPAATIEKLCQLNRTFSDKESELSVAEKGEGFVKCKFVFPSFETEDLFMDAYCHKLIGTLEEIAFQAGGKNVSVNLQKNAGEYGFLVNWE